MLVSLAGCGGEDESAACSDVSWPAPAGCTATDLEGKLRCIPGLAIAPRGDNEPDPPAGYQRFNLVLTQPIDHDHPEAGTFTQRAVLLHISDTAPVVMSTSGYNLSTGRGEITRGFAANQISYEHRYFVDSRPVPTDWSKLDIQQAAADAHNLAEALHWLYPGAWLNTGASKGGMTSVYHRRFYPCDVDATVAYVAPTSNSPADTSYVTFLDEVGGATWQACRADLVAFQRRLLDQRTDIIPLVQGTFTQIPVDKAYEMAVIELNFTLWQYTHPDDPEVGCAAIPGPAATPDEMLAFLEYHVGLNDLAGDASLDFYHAYYHQSASQLGGPAPYETPLADLLQFPGADIAATYIPAGEVQSFDAGAMADVNDWVATEGEQMIFIYGELDPWSSRPFVPSAKDSYKLVVPGGNHGSSIAQLADSDRTTAIAALERWLGTSFAAPASQIAPSSVRRVERGDPDLAGDPRERRPPL